MGMTEVIPLLTFIGTVACAIIAVRRRQWRWIGYAFGALFVGSFLQQWVVEHRANEAGFESIKRYQKADRVGAETPKQLKQYEQDQKVE